MMSHEDLEHYIKGLEAEVNRLREDLNSYQTHAEEQFTNISNAISQLQRDHAHHMIEPKPEAIRPMDSQGIQSAPKYYQDKTDEDVLVRKYPRPS
jgi:hypothetical protein